MKARLRASLCRAALAAIVCGWTIWLVHPVLAQEPEGIPPGGEPRECTPVDQKLNFPAYWVGPIFDGLDLTTVLRSCSGGAPISNEVTYFYGDSLQIQSRPWRLPGRFSEGVVRTDTTVNGIPATWYQLGGYKLEIHHPHVTVTVAIYGQARRIGRVLAALSEGPRRLSRLSALGIVFPSDCVSGAAYCQGDRVGTLPSMVEGITIGVALFLVGPSLAVLFRPRRLESA